MSSSDFKLAPRPRSPRQRELWLQHAAGFIMFEDARQYALDAIDPALKGAARAAAEKAVNDAIYGMMMIIDGVTGNLRGGDLKIDLRMHVRLTSVATDEIIEEIDLSDGDGMCMGYHGWREKDFGDAPVVVPSARQKSHPRARQKLRKR